MVKNHKHRNAFLTDFQIQVCYGTLLGDSSLSRPQNGQNYHLSCYHSEAQADWLNLKWHWLQPHSKSIQYCAYTDKRNGKIYKGNRFHTISAPCFTNLAQVLYPNGQKVIPPNLSSIINHPVALACLICDDGSWDRAGISIASKQFSEDENVILALALTKIFGLSVSTMLNGDYPYTRITADSVKRAFDLCLDYIPKTMYYKFGGKNYVTRLTGKVTKTCPICNKAFSSYRSANQIYCSRRCSSKGKLTGYKTRTKETICPVCKSSYTPYTEKQKTCKNCTHKRANPTPCIICGNPVYSIHSQTCSNSCNVKSGHSKR